MGGGLIAGIAGINKTIAIASILQAEDLTFAIYRLNTWVLTEMWFIIIFGSIPTLRPIFVKFTQDIKSATGISSRNTTKSSNSRGYLNDSRERRQSLVPLNELGPQPWNTPGLAKTSVSHEIDSTGNNREAVETIEPNNQQILVTKKTTIISEECQGR
ncbi:hypothetical protein N7456_009582 [Penicillium angulare]|uniref:Uncharacterized protein n=1 Tax=Penicillium angulare TaxID=116970 RepID=A0A9W9K5V4_9EURO|nr:hypothetical protein N7456_009582 [Penicillium angulare]